MVVVAAGCEKKPSTPTIDLSTPDAAARCQLAAIRAKSLDQWLPCMHPKIRDGMKAEARKLTPQFWTSAAEHAAPLDGVKASDFTLSPIPAGKEDLGDQVASFRLDKDSLELVRKDGRWYIADTGI
jgi:hypothetical protein